MTASSPLMQETFFQATYEIISQRHGGTITVDSEVVNFTEFTARAACCAACVRKCAVFGRR
jgi:hypothetical protein